MKANTLISLTAFTLWLGASMATQAELVQTRGNALTLSGNLETGENWPGGTTLLITHGTLSHNRSELIQTLQGLFKEYGVSSLAINLSLGVDNRQGPVDCKVVVRHKHEDAPLEIGRWVAWLNQQGVRDIALMGHSRGGNQSALYGAGQPDSAVSHLVLLAPALLDSASLAPSYARAFGTPLAPVLARARSLVDQGSPEGLLPDTGFLYCPKATVEAASFISYYTPHPKYRTVSLLRDSTIPTLIIAGSNDTTVPGIADAMAPLVELGKVQLVVIEGADHFFRDLYADELVEATLEFLNVLQ